MGLMLSSVSQASKMTRCVRGRWNLFPDAWRRIGRVFTVRDFDTNWRVLRRALGHFQEGFADLVGLDRTYVGGIERGERNPSLKAILAIA